MVAVAALALRTLVRSGFECGLRGGSLLSSVSSEVISWSLDSNIVPVVALVVIVVVSVGMGGGADGQWQSRSGAASRQVMVPWWPSNVCA